MAGQFWSLQPENAAPTHRMRSRALPGDRLRADGGASDMPALERPIGYVRIRDRGWPEESRRLHRFASPHHIQVSWRTSAHGWDKYRQALAPAERAS